ncbi:hypothetical protein [Roseibium sp. M-1]
MAHGTNQTMTEPYVNPDRINREIAQEAHTDQEMESIVPPTSKNGTVWRIAVVVLLLVALLTGVVLMT